MAQEQLTLNVENRAHPGGNESRKLRAAGKMPAVIYGHGAAPEHVALDARAFEEVLRRGGRTGIVTLVSGKGAGVTALVRDVARNPVTFRLLHADLQRVSATESVHAKLPVVTVGTPRGVKDAGGVMDVIAREIEIAGPANALPQQLELDVTALGIHEHATAANVVLPAGFRLVTPADTIVVSIEASRTAQSVEEAATGATLEQAEPEAATGEKTDEANAGS